MTPCGITKALLLFSLAKLLSLSLSPPYLVLGYEPILREDWCVSQGVLTKCGEACSSLTMFNSQFRDDLRKVNKVNNPTSCSTS